MKRVLVTDGTSGYFATGNALKKVDLSTGAMTNLSTDKEYRALTFGNSVLYGATRDGIYTINVTTGVATAVADLEHIDAMAYQDVNTLLVTSGNSLISIVTVLETATGTVVRDAETVGSVTITDGGGGYQEAPTVTFSGGAGTGAAGTAVINAAGEVTSVTITAAGSGYTSDPDVTFSAGGAAGTHTYLDQSI